VAPVIRAYRPADLEAMLRVWYEASIIAHDFLPAEFFEAERERIPSLYVPIAETWVAEVQDQLVGFIALLGENVGGLFVDPAHQGRGIGRRLLDHARDLRRGHLTVEVFAANPRALAFYERYGFVLRSRHIDDETEQPVLRLRLG
jgi:putative acetyltransferase